MFTHCLSCRVRFPDPGVLDHPVPGEGIAYDHERGRLWSICRNCGSWSLAPIEERWETIEELEELATQSEGVGRPRLLRSTENIELFQIGPIKVVRVGESDRGEEAWWRYGQRLKDDLRRDTRLTVGGAATVGAAIVGGVLAASLPARYAFRGPTDVRRWLRFGDRAWSGRKTCQLCSHVFSSLSFFDGTIVRLNGASTGAGGEAISRRCPGCGDADRGGLRLTGLEAEQTLQRLLAYKHYPGVPERQIKVAMKLIEREGGPSGLVRVFRRYANQLGQLQPAASLALELAANEAKERRLLGLEAAVLEQYWREAEALASVVDGELTSISGAERLRLRATQKL